MNDACNIYDSYDMNKSNGHLTNTPTTCLVTSIEKTNPPETAKLQRAQSEQPRGYTCKDLFKNYDS